MRIKQNKTSKCFYRKPGPCRASIEYMLVLMLKVVMMFRFIHSLKIFLNHFGVASRAMLSFDN